MGVDGRRLPRVSLSLVTLGTGTALADADRGPCGLLVQTADSRVLVDGGAGTQQRLARAGVDPFSLDVVVYSHRHADHTGELVPLLFARKARRLRDRLRIVAAQGFEEFLDGLASAYGPWILDGTHLQLVDRDTPGTVPLTDDLWLHHAPAPHPLGALHLGFEDAHGTRVVFSGDTGPSEALSTLARGASLLVCEVGSDAPGSRPSHLAPEQVRDLVEAARPREVWLTHLYPDTDPDRALALVGSTGVPVRRPDDGDRWPDQAATTSLTSTAPR